jgi:hypothetical protein
MCLHLEVKQLCILVEQCPAPLAATDMKAVNLLLLQATSTDITSVVPAAQDTSQLSGSTLRPFCKESPQTDQINPLCIIIIIINVVSCHRPFLPDTSLELAVIPTAQASSFTLQYFPYYV